MRNVKISCDGGSFNGKAQLLAEFSRTIGGHTFLLAVTRRSTMAGLDVTHLASGRKVCAVGCYLSNAGEGDAAIDAVQKANAAIDALIAKYGENRVQVVISSAG